ncbi:hypothetical protein VD0002_g7259 [Verticillium dahliae]|nr:putative membrane protein [Verticillium dahliae VDG2]PNH44466.1 hypothetical protein VD0004_g3210 [Verticillium dahliae]PNH51681.1 hypothetical protein VD0003_g5571 [Verticillium dahliae]PNH60367.1 hypothetical protein VD0002_g7259 [Verticillium dahliae]
MAGPGGGPPRRSHTKSRKGCETCKRRHIRCDENFPQCRNCTKHKIRCPYNDMPAMEDRSTTPDKPDLMWTPSIVADIEQWQRTGIFPFPKLAISSTPNPAEYSLEDLRLIYHVASISNEMEGLGATNFTLWTRQIPAIIKLGSTHRYVMHSLLAFSAMHIAFLTDCPIVGNLAYEHRGIALKGLQEGIGSFGPETSDAVLAASLVLSWQATDWRSWTQLMQGTSSVVDAMASWSHDSQFYDWIRETGTFPTAPPSPTPDHRPSQPRKEDLDALNRTLAQLQKVEAHQKHNKEDTKHIQQLISFLKGSRKVSPTLSVAQQFERLRPLRTWLFYLPVMALQQSGCSVNSLVTIAHYYTVAVLMERLFPEIGAAYFGNLSIAPVEEIARCLLSINISGSIEGDLTTPMKLMQFPLDMVNEFRNRIGILEPARTPSFPQYNPPNFYTNEPANLPQATESFMPYGNPAFSYSHESLTGTMLNTEGIPQNAVSPLTLSSPFVNHQYLSIPSPNYGSYSPASSTFEGSIAYSDTEEYGSYDMGGMSSGHHMFGSGSNLSGMTTTPGYPPPEDPYLLSSTAHSTVPSPFLQPEQLGMLPLPESPIPVLASMPRHRRPTPPSSSVQGESPSAISAPFPPRQLGPGPSPPPAYLPRSEKGKEREL